MPAKSEAALDRKRKRNAERDACRRQSYRDSQEQSTHIDLSRQHHIQRHTDLSQFDLIECKALGEGSSSHSTRPNLTLADRDTKEIVLQRISPTSYAKFLEAKKSSLIGKHLYDQYLAKKPIPISTISTQKLKIKLTKRKVIEHHLGIWHSRGKQTLDFTKETTDYRYKPEALDLLFWARMHTDLVMRTAQPSIHPSFRSNISSRSKGRKWLASIFGSKSIELLHPWWTTVAFFSNFAGGIHLDNDDCIPSFLFNFGEAAWIELPEFSVKILVKPMDLVILNSRSFYHRTRPFVPPGHSAAGNRWAFSGFFRDAIYHRETVCKVAEWRLDSIFGYQPKGGSS